MSDASRRWALRLCLAAGFTTLIDQSVLNVAIPSIRSSLDAGPHEVQWILAGYSFAFGLALVPGGRLGDAHGRRGYFLAGFALFTLTSVVAGTAQHGWVVAAARIVQGLGAGMVNPQVLGLIQDEFRGAERARALGAYATTGGVAATIGPVVGGALIGVAGPDWGWRLIALINVPFGVATLILAARYLPRRLPVRRRTPLDVPGLILLGALTLCVLLPVTLSGGVPVAVWVAVGAALLAGLVTWERWYARTGRAPVLHPALVRSRAFVCGSLVAMFNFGAVLAMSLVIVLHLQEAAGESPLAAALTTLPSAVAFGLTSAVSWRALARLGPRLLRYSTALGAASALATLACAVWVPDRHLWFAFAITQLAFGISGGLTVSPNQALTLRHAPAEVAGLAAGFLQVVQRISAAVSLAVVSGLALAAPITGYRHATASGLVFCTVLLVGSLIAAFGVRVGLSRSAAHSVPL
ncbi:MFS transporter [Cryptosporangium aurantiacum]|uniref:Major Facilitator Superfamily protein n=1 Tax=Cryptosporangium aurantiacum TaxID=134849 RepID=A0A1M7K9J6_9ACTN|nr:MFS transporter [Cryptosporangium aurantiacum]SHM61851.1 Major Facilitator Superfamily protein [Cryptosporangium aurantiacum]